MKIVEVTKKVQVQVEITQRQQKLSIWERAVYQENSN